MTNWSSKALLSAMAFAIVMTGVVDAQAPRNLKREVIDARIANAAPATPVAIAAGVFTLSQASHILAAESGTADTVTSFVVTAMQAGDTVKIAPDTGDTITIDASITDTGAAHIISGDEFAFVHVQAGGAYTVSLGGAGGEPNYLGSAASAPTTDISGAALDGDEMFFNTTSQNFERYIDHLGGFLADFKFVEVAPDLLFTSSGGDGIVVNSSCVATRGNGSAFPIVEDMPIRFSGMSNALLNSRLFKVVSRAGATFTFADFFDGSCSASWADAGPNNSGQTYSHVRYKYVLGADPANASYFPALSVDFSYTIPKLGFRSAFAHEVGDSFDLGMGRANGNAASPTQMLTGQIGTRVYFQDFDGTNFIPVSGLTYGGASLQNNFPYWARAEFKGGSLEDFTSTERGTVMIFAPIKENTIAAYDTEWKFARGTVNIGDLAQPLTYPHQSFDSKGEHRLNNTSGVDWLSTKTMDANLLLANLNGENLISFREVNSSTDRKELDPATGVNLTTNVVTYTSHGFSDNDLVFYAANGGTPIGGLVSNSGYFVKNSAANTFELAQSAGGATIDLTAGATGTTHSFARTETTWNNRGYNIVLESDQLKFKRVQAGVPHDVMTLHINTERVDFSGMMLQEGSDSATPNIVLRNTSEAGEKQYYTIENNTAGELQIGSGSSLGSPTARFTLNELGTLTLQSTDAGATGAQLNCYHNSPSPAVSDFPCTINFQAEDSAGNKFTTGSIASVTTNVTHGSSTEAAELRFYNRVADNNALAGWFGAGLVIGSPTGGDKGAGTVNATAVYDDNTLLTDYVFDKLAGIEGVYSERVKVKYDALDAAMFAPEAYAAYWRENGRLYGMPDLDDVVDGTGIVDVPLGEMVQRLWQTVELQAIHTDQINDRLTNLETDYGKTKSRMAELFCLLADNGMEACAAQ